MAQEPLATKGNYLHIYDFRVMPGKEAEFIRLFEAFDYSDGNPMHKSWAQVKDGVLCRDTEDPQRFFLIEHKRERLVFNVDEPQSLFRDVPVDRRNRSDRFPVKAHRVVEGVAPLARGFLDGIDVMPSTRNRARAPNNRAVFMR